MRETDPLRVAVAFLLRTVPELWADFDYEALSSTQQRALFLLVAAGLVERRIGVRGEFAAQAPVIEFTIDATGEYGLVEAIDAAVSEMWSKWGVAFGEWKASEASSSNPFRFTHSGINRWRLTEQGVIARGDLDIQAPNRDSAETLGSYQRVIEFVTRTGHLAERPEVRGEGRLKELSVVGIESNAAVSPMPVAITNAQEIATAFNEHVVPRLLVSLQCDERSDKETSTKGHRSGSITSGMTVTEAIARAEAHVKSHRGVFPGRNKLAKIVGCSASLMTKAISRSPYLNARKAEHEATKRRGNPVRQTSQSLDEHVHDPDWKESEKDRDDTLDKLVAEQKAEQSRDEAQHVRARRRKSRD